MQAKIKRTTYDVGEIHETLHQLKALLGIKQCTATQMMGICAEFWVGALAAWGTIKVKHLLAIKKQFNELLLKNQKKPKKKKKSKKRKS